MSSLGRWLETQRCQLPLPVWLDLSLGVARLDGLVKREEFSAAELQLSGLYSLIRKHDLQEWQVFVQLMEGSLVLAATSNLNRVMDIGMRALSTAERVTGTHSHALRLGARLLVTRCWLKIDEVGYAREALAVGEDTLTGNDLGEWEFWFLASNAWALWALGRQEEANAVLASMLVKRPVWTNKADEFEGRAYIAYRMRRQAEAAGYYKQAAAYFEADGLLYSATRCRLNRALCLLEVGEHEASLGLLEETLPRTHHLSNPHYRGLGHCFRGRNALALHDYERAVEDLNQALTLYKGRGWLRDEAQMSIERLEAMRALGGHSDWEEAAGCARQCVSRLRSTDLQPRLAEALRGH